MAGLEATFKVPGVSNPSCSSVLYPIMGKFRSRYPGRSRKLVIAFDIGTSFSGAAYALLEPGEVPRIRSVKRQVLLMLADLVPLTNEGQISKLSEHWIRESSFYTAL